MKEEEKLFENPEWKCLKFGLPWGKFWLLSTLTQLTNDSRHPRFWSKKQKNCLGKTVLKMRTHF